MFAFVVLGLVSSVLAKKLAGKNISEMTHFVSSGTYNLNSKSESYVLNGTVNLN